jgi:hypothetical protein
MVTATVARRRTSGCGYTLLYLPDHPNAQQSGFVLEHIVVVAQALGKPMPASAVVHHINGNRRDNRPENLVACEGHQYHSLLHARARALEQSGDPGLRYCRYCKRWDRPENLWLRTHRVVRRRSRERTGRILLEGYHRWCHALVARMRVRGGARGRLLLAPQSMISTPAGGTQ